jgi:hypothetical protein
VLAEIDDDPRLAVADSLQQVALQINEACLEPLGVLGRLLQAEIVEYRRVVAARPLGATGPR